MEKSISAIAASGAVFTVAVALLTDLRSGKIPNALTVGSCVCAAVYQIGWGGGIAAWLAGTMAGFGVFLLPVLLHGMGGGDAKLFAALGAWLGWRGILLSALFTAAAGGMIAIVVLARNGGEWDGVSRLAMAWRTRDPELIRRSERFPYTIPAAIGMAGFFWWSWA
jgi:prepilin peptidase CpaA